MSTEYFSEARRFKFSGVHTVREFRDHHAIDMLTPDSQVYAALLYKTFAKNGFEVESKRDRKNYSNSALMRKGRDKTVTIDGVSVSPVYKDGGTVLDNDTELLLNVEGSVTSYLMGKRADQCHRDADLLIADVYNVLVKRFLPSTSNSEE